MQTWCAASYRTALKETAQPIAPGRVVKHARILFTSVCPLTAQPDFGFVLLEYETSGLALEMSTWERYLASFREVGAFCEVLAAGIADDVVDAISPNDLLLMVSQKPRGGIALNATARRHRFTSPLVE